MSVSGPSGCPVNGEMFSDFFVEFFCSPNFPQTCKATNRTKLHQCIAKHRI
jgi:hypothetical protein